MKKPLAALATLVMLATSGAAVAASSVDLTVTGLITPTACTPSLSANGVVDHGKISAKDLSPTNWTALPPAVLKLAIACDAHTLFAVQATDNRAGSATAPTSFGLGFVNGTQKFGQYSLEYGNPVNGDGGPLYPILSRDGGLTWMNNEDASTGPLALAGFRDTRFGQLGPIPLKNVTADLMVITFFNPTNSWDMGQEEVEIDGLATLEVKYL
ncbi:MULTISPECIES: DUF1120 domain-containing protein [Pseudomonas]|jgi:hypothetical protein|uniref:Uncharacterized protein n=4 Tax=Pseudomonas TaxID=286 RepID=A0ACA7P1M4_9PSED|nr:MULTISPECIES: DUF1120 domain-containing protein [unclassified Pseudomonas]AHC33798.1 hypothetical protein U771_06255 [Pseudomonas sp. TKP]WLD69123.1 DUF1120 domain-containing protein [Pseudomonas sp. OVF7]WLI52439.1 DUF1120 domain-containing protein [Pseudomonas sp. FP833]SDY63916.1 Protein of unknown function [Pseudomonas sp. PDC86]